MGSSSSLGGVTGRRLVAASESAPSEADPSHDCAEGAVSEADFDYKLQVDKLLLGMQFIASVDIAAIQATVRHAHSYGPFADPTGYREALQKGDMDAIGELARRLGPAVEHWNREIAPRVPRAARL